LNWWAWDRRSLPGFLDCVKYGDTLEITAVRAAGKVRRSEMLITRDLWFDEMPRAFSRNIRQIRPVISTHPVMGQKSKVWQTVPWLQRAT
jgi:hypothetical protein